MQGSFAAPAASDFLDGQKVTKEPPRGGLRIGTACPYSPAPWTPILRGPQSGSLGGHRKGAGGQRIGFRSMTAAAEFPVTFGWSAPFGLVGLKFGSEGRRIPRCFRISVGATLAVARSCVRRRVQEAAPYGEENRTGDGRPHGAAPTAESKP